MCLESGHFHIMLRHKKSLHTFITHFAGGGGIASHSLETCVLMFVSAATVSSQQSTVGLHRLVVLQLPEDDPGVLLLTQSHPGK